jgi:hypothetical protein
MKPTRLLTPTGRAVRAGEAARRCDYRTMEEAEQAVKILKQRAMLGKKEPRAN